MRNKFGICFAVLALVGWTRISARAQTFYGTVVNGSFGSRVLGQPAQSRDGWYTPYYGWYSPYMSPGMNNPVVFPGAGNMMFNTFSGQPLNPAQTNVTYSNVRQVPPFQTTNQTEAANPLITGVEQGIAIGNQTRALNVQASELAGNAAGQASSTRGAERSMMRPRATFMVNPPLRLPPIAGTSAVGPTGTSSDAAYSGSTASAPPLAAAPSPYTVGYPPSYTAGRTAHNPLAQAERVINGSARIKRLSPITVTIENGAAVLRGQVITEEDRTLVELLARMEPGVWEVRNELMVASPPAMSAAPSIRR